MNRKAKPHKGRQAKSQGWSAEPCDVGDAFTQAPAPFSWRENSLEVSLVVGEYSISSRDWKVYSSCDSCAEVSWALLGSQIGLCQGGKDFTRDAPINPESR